MSSPAPADRPEPIRDAARRLALILAAAVALAVYLGNMGLLSATTVDLAESVAVQLHTTAAQWVAVLNAAVSGAATWGGIVGVVRAATGRSTPIDDPRDVDMTPLVRADGLPLGGRTWSPLHSHDAPPGPLPPADYRD